MNSHELEANNYKTIAETLYNDKQYEIALAQYKVAFELTLKERDFNLHNVIEIGHRIIRLHLKLHNVYNALSYFLDLMKLYHALDINARKLQDITASMKITKVQSYLYALMARAYTETDQFNKAFSEAESAILIYKDNLEALTVLGTVYITRNEYDKALEALLHAIAIMPQYDIAIRTHTYLRKLMMQVEKTNNNMPKALAHIKNAYLWDNTNSKLVPLLVNFLNNHSELTDDIVGVFATQPNLILDGVNITNQQIWGKIFYALASHRHIKYLQIKTIPPKEVIEIILEHLPKLPSLRLLSIRLDPFIRDQYIDKFIHGVMTNTSLTSLTLYHSDNIHENIFKEINFHIRNNNLLFAVQFIADSELFKIQFDQSESLFFKITNCHKLLYNKIAYKNSYQYETETRNILKSRRENLRTLYQKFCEAAHFTSIRMRISQEQLQLLWEVGDTIKVEHTEVVDIKSKLNQYIEFHTARLIRVVLAYKAIDYKQELSITYLPFEICKNIASFLSIDEKRWGVDRWWPREVDNDIVVIN